MPAYHFVKHHAKTPDIGSFINVPAARLLGRHITNSPEYGPEIRLNQQQRFVSWHRRRQFLLRELCNPEVEHFHVAVRPEHDVLRFDVAMNGSRLMCGGERTRHLDRDVISFTQLHRSTSEAITQRLAFDQFTGYVMN